MDLNVIKLANMETGQSSQEFLDKVDSKLMVDVNKSQIVENDEWIEMVEFSLPHLEKALTKEIKKYLFNDDTSILYASRKDINKDLEKLNDYFDELNRNNNIEELTANNSIVNKKEEYIDNYIYNSIVNHSLYRYEHISMIVKNKNNIDKITIEDLIQEVAYQNSRRNKYTDKQRRKLVLDNYFKGNNSISKFPSKHQMEKALKNINYEMEKASQEFSKLFNYDDKSK